MSYEDGDKEKLNNLENKLYSRGAPDILDKGRSSLVKEEANQAEMISPKETIWGNARPGKFDEISAKMSHLSQKKSNFINKLFIVSLLFFALASVVAVFVFIGGGNLVSSKNVDILVFGPVSIPSGQEVSFDINVVNNNNTDLTSAVLLVEYPDGTRSSLDLSKDLIREKFDIGVVKSKESYKQTVNPVIFGDKDELRNIKISLEYRVENSSALFYKEKNHEVVISSAPVIITPIYPKEINSNQDISFDLELTSNSKDKLSNLLVNLEYPFGFVFKGASPEASFGNDVWKVSSLNPGEKKKITIRGAIIGQNNEEKVFRIKVGTPSEDDERVIAVAFSEVTETILLKRSFIELSAKVNGVEGDAVVPADGSVNVNLDVRNNLPSRLFNLVTKVEFKGNAFDRNAVSPSNGGFFESLSNRIIWDKRGVSNFADMEPGRSQSLSFSFTPLSYGSIPKGSKPQVDVTVTTEGERVLESGSVEKVSATETLKVSLSTNIYLGSKIYRSEGNIENYGPIPPKADTPTSYTVHWSLGNTFNQVSNVEVRAELPLYVKWKGLYSPSGEKISFNSVTNQVVWEVGSVLPDTGSSSKREVYFQIELTPSINQIGNSPMLVGDARLTGIDKVTGLKLNTSARSLDTNFGGDSTFRIGDEKVSQ